MHSMAHYVAKVLHIAPREILYTWSVSELIVAYGVYRNEEQTKLYYEIESYNKTVKGKDKKERVDRYAVYFYTKEELMEGGMASAT